MLTRAMVVGVAVAGVAIGSAAPAWAVDRLEGDYRYTNGATVNTWTITSQCNPEGLCGGTVSSSTGMLVHIGKQIDGPWTVNRHDVPNGRVCADGSTGPADQSYSFDPVSLTGTLSYSWPAGTCGDPHPGHAEEPISLTPL
ncbi:hypothetical protein [Mycolicibacterium sp. XJ1819]